jgi:hypothetical protein
MDLLFLGMSHHPETGKPCPNCGHAADLNYCAQCGQETHLHKETFWGLILHFVAHYFHYDSKFWQTIKALIAMPGQLTVAYWNQQRARYIPPISLYIFISTLYFIISYATMPGNIKNMADSKYGHMADSMMASKKTPDIVTTVTDERTGKTITTTTTRPHFNNIMQASEMIEKISHHMPKVYFFMVPFFAFLLKLFFIRRKDLYFVDHAIYSLHFHSLAFFVMMIQSLLGTISFILLFTGPLVYLFFIIYSTMAMKRVYAISKGKAVLYTFLLGIIYSLVTAIITMVLLIIFYQDMFIY